MSIKLENLTMPGALPMGENPQAKFRSKIRDAQLVHDNTLTHEELERFGKDCKARVLPYRMQDRYIRSEENITLKTIVMENSHIKAVFLPEFGGKLWSLFSKDENRELLFVNPVFRPANLANRNAWTAGGIEWNLGHTGHCAFTCDNLHCTIVKADDGEEFLRMYEYEASHAQLMQLDFHLPENAKQLAMHVHIENVRNDDAALYWWTNAAVKLTHNTRIFSATSDILYQLIPDQTTLIPGFGRYKMPLQPNLECDDMSYPMRIPHSIEYFFQNPKSLKAPWEVAIEGDCKGYFERSTQPLFARKMFCWGIGSGGLHWCDYLSLEGEGDYIEVQAGLAPTQNHSALIKGGEVISFTQMFGAFTAPQNAQTDEWNTALVDVAKAVEETLPTSEVVKLNEEYAKKALVKGGQLINVGSGFGALENARRKAQGESEFATHLEFPLTDDVKAWVGVLNGEELENTAAPATYVIDPLFEGYLKAAAEKTEAGAYQYAIFLVENDRESEALPILQKLSQNGDAFATHALGAVEMREQNFEGAAEYFVDALKKAGDNCDVSFAESAMEALLKSKEFAKVWGIYNSGVTRSETMRLLACEAAVKLNEWAFLEDCFEHDFAAIREGAAGLGDIWYEYKARKTASENGVEFTMDMIDKSLPLPKRLDFHMFDYEVAQP